MATTELNEFSSVAEMFEYHKEKAACDDVAAAVLALAEVIRRTPADLASSIENGLDAVSSFSVRLSGDVGGAGAARHDRAETARAPKPDVSNGSIGEIKPPPASSNGTTKAGRANGRLRARVRGDRNHADLGVIEDFMPDGEGRRLASFLESMGIDYAGKHNGQEMLTLVVHYVTKTRKIPCTHSHIHTVLKTLGVATPSDLGARLRDVGRRLKFIDPSDGNNVKLTIPGENWVDIGLPKRAAAAKAAKK